MNNFQLSLNTLERTLAYKGVEKRISDSFWIDEIVPLLYPLWSSDKDKLEYFIKKDDGSYIIFKNKYTKNHKTRQYKWTPYEDDISEYTKDELDGLYEQLRTKFLEYNKVENKDIDEYLRREYARDNVLSWGKIRLIRNFLLTDSDWTQMEDNDLSEEEKKQWLKYRAFLRNIPNKSYDLDMSFVKFPITPTKYKALGDTTYLYLENKNGHYYNLNNSIVNDLSERIVHYLAISISIGKHDESSINLLNTLPSANFIDDPNYENFTFDRLLEYVIDSSSNFEGVAVAATQGDELDRIIDYVSSN